MYVIPPVGELLVVGGTGAVAVGVAEEAHLHRGHRAREHQVALGTGAGLPAVLADRRHRGAEALIDEPGPASRA